MRIIEAEDFTLSNIHMPLLFLVLPVVATLLGGLLAIRFRRFRPLLMAVGAGLLLGAAFLDLLPEAIALGTRNGLSAADVLALTLLFFLLFAALEAGLAHLFHGHHSPRRLGRIGGALLIFHSFRDGMAIGAAFASSHTAGFAVALGITAHDLGDGMNTVLLTTAGERPRRSDYLFLVLDAVAPFVGGLLTVWWLLSSRHATMLLALAAAFFLQMATADFLPQLRATPLADTPPSRQSWLMLAVIAGAAAIYATNLLLGAN
jgi:zinc and cadmium transporter